MPFSNPAMNDLVSLLAFQSVLRSGSLSQAARSLGVPKSTLSRRIRDLEESLGQVLIRREARRLIPTEAGEVLAKYADRLLLLAEQGQEALRDLGTEVCGELTIYAENALVRAWLADVVYDFLSQHPEVQLSLKTRIVAPSVDNHSQVHFWLGTPPEHGLRQELLGLLPVGLYASPSYLASYGTPQHPADLERHLWVQMEGQGPDLILERGSATEAVRPQRAALEVDQLILLGDALARHMGVGLLPDWLARMRIQAHPETLVSCLPDWKASSEPLWLLYPHGHMPRRLSTFLTYIREQAPAEWRAQPTALP